VRGVALEGFGHLDRQLARRRQHQRLHGDWFLTSMRDRTGSAKAAVLPVPVWACPSTSRLFHQERNGGGLDRRRRFVTELFQYAQQRFTEIEVGKQGKRGFGHEDSLVLFWDRRARPHGDAVYPLVTRWAMLSCSSTCAGGGNARFLDRRQAEMLPERQTMPGDKKRGIRRPSDKMSGREEFTGRCSGSAAAANLARRHGPGGVRRR
jgi:hypothetical protein